MDKKSPKKKTQMFDISVIIMQEGRSFTAYAPALELSTCGDTLAEAERNFKEAAGLFFETLQEWGTTEAVLMELGWKKVKENWQPPVIVSPKVQSFSIPVYV